MHGTMPIHFDVQSTMKRCALHGFVSLTAVIHMDNFGVVQPFQSGEVNGIWVKHNDAYWWALIWQQLDIVKQHKLHLQSQVG